ncbi:MAG: MATE family efflux transporter [Eubacteriales bacterium]|nr:MATE family efflux transporter [Eubacteriales bacterium]
MSKKIARRTSLDMTEGNPTSLLLKFAVPLLLGNFLQQTYNIVDSLVVGNYVGKEALGAVGSVMPVTFLFISLFMGLAIGSTVIIAQYFGAKDKRNVQLTIETIYKAYVVMSIVITALSLFFINDLLHLMGVPEDIFDFAKTYLSIIFLGYFALFGYNVNNSILQGVGDTISSLYYLAIAVVINIVLDLLFVGYFSWGVAGAAYATVIANFCSFVFGVWHINKREDGVRVRLFTKNFSGPILREAYRLGIPAGLQNVIFSVGMLAVVRLVNSYGTNFIAGYNAAIKIDGLAFLPITSYASATTAYVGQNIGANRMDRVRKGVRAALRINFVTAAILAPLVVFMGPKLLSLFLDQYDPEVIAAGMAYLWRVVPFLWALGFLFIINSAIRGAGSSLMPMLITFFGLILGRVPLAYGLNHYFGRDNIFWSWPLGWALALVIAITYYLSGRWHNKSRLQFSPELSNEKHGSAAGVETCADADSK